MPHPSPSPAVPACGRRVARAARGPLLLALLLAGLPGGVPATPAWAGDPAVAKEVEVLQKNASEPFEQDKRAAAIRRLGHIGGAEAAAALVPLVTDPFEHLADHVVSAWIQMQKGAQAPEAQTFLVKSALGHKQPAVRAAAALALGLGGGAELADAWRPALARESAPEVLVALARGAVACRTGTLVPEAFVPLLAHPDGAVVLAAAEAAASAPDASEAALRKALVHKEPLARAGAFTGLARAGRATEADLARVLADKAPEPRIALADAFEALGALVAVPGAGEETLAALLVDPSWRVRAAAIECALRLWQPRAVPLLIERLAQEPGRLRLCAYDALRTLTGVQHPDDPDVWRRWWSSASASFDLGPRPTPDRWGRLRRAGGHAEGRPGGPAEVNTTPFFDLPLCCSRIAFVFDLSGSMSKAASAEGGPSKLEVTQREFERALKALPEAAALDVLVYRYPSTFPPKPLLTRALGRLSPVNDAARKKVLGWVAAQPAKGWGAFYEALVAAAAEDAETVVLLSDGVPSRGRYERDDRLLAEWARANRFRRVVVDTVLVGEKGADKAFMEELAWVSSGRATVARLGASAGPR